MHSTFNKDVARGPGGSFEICETKAWCWKAQVEVIIQVELTVRGSGKGLEIRSDKSSETLWIWSH